MKPRAALDGSESIVLTIVLMAFLVGGFFYGRMKFRIWKAGAAERKAKAAKAANEARRPLAHRLHNVMPDRLVQRVMAWNPEKRSRPTVRIARRSFRGRYERINPAQHIAVIGMTGSGKSSTLRVLGAYALMTPGWYLEAWDGKWGASVISYKGKCPVLTDIDEIEARLRDLVERELPLRATTPDASHLAIIMDESRLLNMLSNSGMTDLVTVIQTGRQLGVHLWFGLQDPKADSVPTAVRDQFACKLVHMLQNQEAATVALKELVTGGWHPHKLMRSGQLLVWEPVRRPKVLLGLWLSESDLAALEVSGETSAPEFAVRVDLTKATGDRPTVMTGVQPAISSTRSVGRSVGLTERQSASLMVLGEMGAMSPAALAYELGIDRRRALEVLKQLVEKGLATTTESGSYDLAEEQS